MNLLLKKLKSVKNPQEKCDIAVNLSFIKNKPEIIESIIKLLPLWEMTSYSGSKIIVYSRLIVNYYSSDKTIFLKLLKSKNVKVRRIISHAFCFTILADGVDNKKANLLYKKEFIPVLLNYYKKEPDKKLAKFVKEFLDEQK